MLVFGAYASSAPGSPGWGWWHGIVELPPRPQRINLHWKRGWPGKPVQLLWLPLKMGQSRASGTCRRTDVSTDLVQLRSKQLTGFDCARRRENMMYRTSRGRTLLQEPKIWWQCSQEGFTGHSFSDDVALGKASRFVDFPSCAAPPGACFLRRTGLAKN